MREMRVAWVGGQVWRWREVDCVLVVELLRLASSVDGDSGGKRNLRDKVGVALLEWSCPALRIYHSTTEWSMKISNWVT